jgi:hypothetical protein
MTRSQMKSQVHAYLMMGILASPAEDPLYS